jgi:hypothetical protein
MPQTEPPVRRFAPTWKGELVLACKKCQRKLRKHHGDPALARIRRWFRARGKRDPLGPAAFVINVPCMKLCPKNAVTLFPVRQLAADPPGISMARSEADLERLYASLRP